ncbi:hypothetical protein [Algicella marina]|uniref:Yip1 domain-containing protein n=1 Tax=Algicella marina TaxID=2683284 RepID=A0A6P1T2T2_9RHOB|nr:hypothetical protein [Algicella marina]QHQ34812.1 hypothetical protein GO499_06165 [Algicella marina]
MQTIVEAYRDVPGDFARRSAHPPGEPRLLVYAFVAGLAGFVSGLPGTLAEARAGIAETGEGEVSAYLIAAFFGAVFIFPLFLYGLAALVRVISRMFGGTGTGPGTRHAVFWGVLLALPLGILGALAGPWLAGVHLWLLNGILYLGFLWLLSGTVLVAENFRHRAKVIFAFLVPSLFFLALAVLS